MPIENFGIEGPLLITPDVFSDDRGYFFESWNRRRFASALELDPDQTPNFVQDNQSCSSRGVLRGLHYQVAPMPQAKLVRCVHGEIFDVAVDCSHLYLYLYCIYSPAGDFLFDTEARTEVHETRVLENVLRELAHGNHDAE